MFQLWQATMGEDSGMVGMGTNVSLRTEVQSQRRVRFLGGGLVMVVLDGKAGLEAWGIGGGPLAWAGEGMDGLFRRGGMGGGVFFEAIADWIMELSLSLNLSIVL